MINIQKATKETMHLAAQRLTNGEVIICGVDSNYILCAAVGQESAVKRIAELKWRSQMQPFVVISNPRDANRYAEMTEWQEAVFKHFLPGPISFIVPNRNIPSYINGGTRTLALAWHDNWIMQQLYEECGPYIGTSANPHGQAPPVIIEEAVAYFGSKIPLYLDSGPTTAKYGKPNTIVDLTKTPIELVRDGPANFEEIKVFVEMVRGT